MAYTSQAEIEAAIPPAFLLEATDDDASGAADTDLLAAIISMVENEINGLLQPAISTPITGTVPAKVKHAALVLSCEALYRRRGIANEGNPWSEQAKDVREEFKKIGEGNGAIESGEGSVAGFNEHTLAFSEDET